jgi:hypothetical protein
MGRGCLWRTDAGAVALPKLDVAAVNKLFCSLRGRLVVGAFKRNRVMKMAVGADEVGTIFRQLCPVDTNLGPRAEFQDSTN